MTDMVAYIHGTAVAEQARLAELNRLTNPAFVAFLAVPEGARVLEVGSGLGLLCAAVAASAPGVRVVGLEQAPEQIAAAGAAPGVEFVCGDAHDIPFADSTFDVVYARYLLEHVRDPVVVLSELRRVLRPGGRIAVQENDISLLRVDPPCVAFDAVWACFARLQERLGGDACIGSKLHRLFRRAELSAIELSVQPELHWRGSPGFEGWVANLIGNVESGRHALQDRGLATGAEIDAAIAELEALRADADASITFVWNRAAATRQ